MPKSAPAMAAAITSFHGSVIFDNVEKYNRFGA